jgi:hypothetical protein
MTSFLNIDHIDCTNNGHHSQQSTETILFNRVTEGKDNGQDRCFQARLDRASPERHRSIVQGHPGRQQDTELRSLSEPGIRIDLQTTLLTQKNLTEAELKAMTGIDFENVVPGWLQSGSQQTKPFP